MMFEPELFVQVEELADHSEVKISRLVRDSCQLMTNIGPGGLIIGVKRYEITPELEAIAKIPGRSIRLEPEKKAKGKRQKAKVKEEKQEIVNHQSSMDNSFQIPSTSVCFEGEKEK